jgi:hypothetical protein
VVPEVELAGPQVRARFLGGRDDLPTFPDDGSAPAGLGAMPAPGGWRLSTLTIAAGATDDYHSFIVNAMGPFADANCPGFHRTPTLDLILVIAGELTLELDAGVERIMRQGDSAVLNGVRHRWHNRGSDDVVLAAIMMGASA